MRNIFFPCKCIFCGRILSLTTELNCCGDCARSLPYVPNERCPICGRVTSTGANICFECANHPPPFGKHISALYYKGSVRSAILMYKFFDREYFKNMFGNILSGYVTRLGNFDIVTAVPVSGKRFAQRGYNQSELMARRLCRIAEMPYQECLKKIRDTKPQSRIGFRKRTKNVKGAFAVINRGEVAGKNILLIDDVYTTGATMRECSKVLKRAGAAAVYGLTLAMTPSDWKMIKK